MSNYDVFRQVATGGGGGASSSSTTAIEQTTATTKLGDYFAVSHELYKYFTTVMVSSGVNPGRLAHRLAVEYPGLVPAERMAIVNTLPRNMCVLSLLIEVAEERYTQEQLEAIVALVSAEVPEPEQEES